MMFMNEWDVEREIARADQGETPNRLTAARTLAALVDWTNSHSDGWAYWPKPARAAKSLMTLIQSGDRYDPEDVTEADLKKALTPVKAFLTRQGVEHAEVLG